MPTPLVPLTADSIWARDIVDVSLSFPPLFLFLRFLTIGMARGSLIDPDIASAVHNLRARNVSWNAINSTFGHKRNWAYCTWKKYDASTGLPIVLKKKVENVKRIPLATKQSEK